GLRQLALVNHTKARRAAARLTQINGVALATPSFFNEFTLSLPVEARPVVRALAERQVLGGVSLGRLYPGINALENGLVVAVTEVVSDDDVEALATALEGVLA
ncbi:MAG: glycine dehydrogenase, partial [Alphaproteobacteria bacterium]|nr:glycine dehydrogenase [Alphaproteobacteria bacterium]